MEFSKNTSAFGSCISRGGWSGDHGGDPITGEGSILNTKCSTRTAVYRVYVQEFGPTLRFQIYQTITSQFSKNRAFWAKIT